MLPCAADPLLLQVPLPEAGSGSDLSREQLNKDLSRDRLLVQGCRILGE